MWSPETRRSRAFVRRVARLPAGTLLLASLLAGLWAGPAAAKIRHVPMPVRLAEAKAVALVEVARPEEVDAAGALAELDVLEVLVGDLEVGRGATGSRRRFTGSFLTR